MLELLNNEEKSNVNMEPKMFQNSLKRVKSMRETSDNRYKKMKPKIIVSAVERHSKRL